MKCELLAFKDQYNKSDPDEGCGLRKPMLSHKRESLNLPKLQRLVRSATVKSTLWQEMFQLWICSAETEI